MNSEDYNMKKCSKCHIEKNENDFYFRKDRNSYYSCCIDCKLQKNKEWYENNFEYHKSLKKDWIEKNKDYVKNYWSLYSEHNFDKLSEKSKLYYKNNSEVHKQWMKNWRERNPEYHKIYDKEYNIKHPEFKKNYIKKKRHNDDLFRLSGNIQRRVKIFLDSKNMTKKNKTFDIVGCSPNQLKEHLEKKFNDGMSWDNYGKWHIDHIIPLSSANNEDEVYKLCHHTNLQPLWAEDNLKKSNKIL
jgi:Holliday junction resolvase-like predicted endonuclease